MTKHRNICFFCWNGIGAQNKSRMEWVRDRIKNYGF